MRFMINENRLVMGSPYNDRNNDNTIGKGRQELLNEKGYMCPIGHILLKLGFKEKDILYFEEPKQLKKRIPYLVYNGNNTKFAEDIISISDDDTTTIQQKKRLLRELFKKNKHSIVFYKGKKAKTQYD